MNARRLFLITIALSSAALGAGVAIRMRPNLPVARQAIQSQSAPQAAPSQLQATAPVMAPPSAALFSGAAPAATVPIATTPTRTTEFTQIRMQLQRAIRERNPALLRSLLQVGSLRDGLGAAAVESVNVDDVDASTWKLLEKAIDYRCRQQINSGRAVPEICLTRSSARPAQ